MANNRKVSSLNPYLFILKEGVEIKDDLLDYSLMILNVNCREIMKSPYNHPSQTSQSPASLESLAAACEREMNLPNQSFR